MTKAQAHRMAKTRSCNMDEPVFVVFDASLDYDGSAYDYATSEDLETFFAGIDPIAAYVAGELEA